MSGVHQFVPMLHPGDAVGKHTLAVRTMLRASGWNSEIYVELDDPRTTELTHPSDSYPGAAEIGDVLLYQFATASDLAPFLCDRPETLIVNYHNVTPPEMFAPWDNTLARHQVRALGELDRLASRATLGVAVSEWNRRDLVDAGFGATAVVPPMVNLAANPNHASATATNPRNPHPGQPTGARWLSVGRLAPNKSLQDVLTALLAFRRTHDPDAELTVIGKEAVPAYAGALRRFAAELGLANAVHFRGQVDDVALEEAYRTADVLVVMSEHEGFCLPVVEAMARQVPVVAYREGALTEVLGDGGILLDTKVPVTVAAAVHRLRTTATHRADVVQKGTARLAQRNLGTAGSALVALCAAAHDGSPWPEAVTVHTSIEA